MQKYLETKLFNIVLTNEASASDYDSMHMSYEFSVHSVTEGFVAYESVSAARFTGYYQRDVTITVDHNLVTINQIRELLSELDIDGSTNVSVQDCLDKEVLQFNGYADLFINELNSQEIKFKLEKNEVD